MSPGSTVLLRGHVDNAMVAEFRKQGGEPFVRQMALKAMELSKKRAGEIERLLIESARSTTSASRPSAAAGRSRSATELGAEPARRGAVVHAGVAEAPP